MARKKVVECEVNPGMRAMLDLPDGCPMLGVVVTLGKLGKGYEAGHGEDDKHKVADVCAACGHRFGIDPGHIPTGPPKTTRGMW